MLLLLVWTVCYLAATSKPAPCVAMKKEGRRLNPVGLGGQGNWKVHLSSLGSEKRKHSLSSHWEKVKTLRAGQSETSHWDNWATFHVFPVGLCSTGIKAGIFLFVCFWFVLSFCFCFFTKSGCCTTSRTPHLSLTILVTMIYVLTNVKQFLLNIWEKWSVWGLSLPGKKGVCVGTGHHGLWPLLYHTTRELAFLRALEITQHKETEQLPKSGSFLLTTYTWQFRINH